MCLKKKTTKKVELEEGVSPIVFDEKMPENEKIVEKIEKKKEKSPLPEEKKQIDAAEQVVGKASQKKKKIWNIVFFLVNIGVVVGILVYQLLGTGDGFVPLSLLGVQGLPLFLLFVFFFLAIIFDTLGMCYLVKKDTGKSHFGLSFKVDNVGRYYDAITPMAAGGQPFQVTYLKKHGVSGPAALSIPITKMIFQQMASFVISTIALIVSFVDPSFNTFVSIASIIGFVLSFAVLFVSIFLSVSKKLGKKIVVWCLKLLQKMKIIKNYEKQYQRVTKYIEDFQSIMQKYAKSPKDFFVMFFLALTRLIIFYSSPFLIYWCFMGFVPGLYFKFFVMGILVDLAASFFPLPGGTGMNEISFTAMFAGFFSGGPLFWALIFWRTFTYYGVLLFGLSIFTYDTFYGERKYRWKTKQSELQEESRIFKQEQIQKFRKDRLTRRKKTNKQTI